MLFDHPKISTTYCSALKFVGRAELSTKVFETTKYHNQWKITWKWDGHLVETIIIITEILNDQLNSKFSLRTFSNFCRDFTAARSHLGLKSVELLTRALESRSAAAVKNRETSLVSFHKKRPPPRTATYHWRPARMLQTRVINPRTQARVANAEHRNSNEVAATTILPCWAQIIILPCDILAFCIKGYFKLIGLVGAHFIIFI